MIHRVHIRLSDARIKHEPCQNLCVEFLNTECKIHQIKANSISGKLEKKVSLFLDGARPNYIWEIKASQTKKRRPIK